MQNTKVLSQLFLLTALVFFHLVVQGQPTPVAHYPFSNNAQDNSGNGNNGTVNGASLTLDRFGNGSGAYEFDGVNDQIDYTPNSQNFKPDLPVTIAAWVRFDNFNDVNLIFGNDNLQNRYQGVWLQTNTQGRLTAHFGDGGNINPSNRQSAAGTTILNTNQWYYVAAVIRGAGDMDLYVDGKDDCPIFSGTGGPDPDYTNNDGVSGYHDSNSTVNQGDNWFDGVIDEIWFFDQALTRDEIVDFGYGGPIPGDSSNCDDNCEMVAGFTTTTTGLSVDFTDISTSGAFPITYLIWDFGDGTTQITSPGATITHQYATNGNFYACVTAVYHVECDFCSETFCAPVVLGCDRCRTAAEQGEEAAVIELPSWELYPNPATDFITLEISNLSQEDLSFTIVDLAGRKVMAGEAHASNRIDVSRLAPGTYLITLKGAGFVDTKKVLIK